MSRRDITIESAGGGGGGGGVWKPDPPAAGFYAAHTTGTVTVSASPGNGATIDSLFHHTWQKIVHTKPSGTYANGVRFAIWLTSDNTSTHQPSSWRLRRSNDDGATWTTIWDSTAQGDPQYGICPGLELDENENLYVVATYFSAGFTSVTKMYTFSAASDYTPPAGPVTLTTLAAGKMALFLDQGRQWIWLLMWSHGNSSANLFAFDYNGVQKYSRNIFKPYTRDWTPSVNGATDLHAPSAHYPAIQVDSVDGTVYVGWTSFAFQGGDFAGADTSFYDVRFVYSTSTKAQFLAGTDTWQGPTNRVSGATSTRTVPFCADDSSATDAEIAFPICKLADQSQFIPATDAGYFNGSTGKFNYSRLVHMTPHAGSVDFYYESETSNVHAIQHHSEARFDMTTHSITDSERRSPFKCDLTTAGDRLGAQVGEGSGNYVHDTTQTNRLYFVTRTLADGDGKILVFRRDDGVNWWQYAVSSPITVGANGLLLVQAYRWVGADGIIYGIVQLADSPYTIYTFKVTPV